MAGTADPGETEKLIYTVCVSEPGGYDRGTNLFGGSVGCVYETAQTITLAEGESAECTINNDDDAPTLKLIKTVTNDSGGNNGATEWTLIAAGSSPGINANGTGNADMAMTAVTDVTANVPYTLSESGPTGYDSGTNYSCTGEGVLDPGPQTIPLAVGESGVGSMYSDDA